MRFVNDLLFLSAYSGGDHIVYDPSMPWDQMNNVNPKTLQSVGPDLIRPESKSIIGPDGNFWTGWAASYGVYGGGITRVNTTTYEVSVCHNPVPGQMVAGMDADDRFIYSLPMAAAMDSFTRRMNLVTSACGIQMEPRSTKLNLK